MSQPHGGQVFPMKERDDAPGMSLRDFLAASALNGMIASDSSVDRTQVDKNHWARVAYEFADAMLTESKP